MQILINFKPVSEGLPIDGMRCIVFGGGKWFDGLFDKNMRAWECINEDRYLPENLSISKLVM